MRSWRWYAERLGPLVALLLLIAGTAIVEAATVPPESRAFLSFRNFSNILGQWSYVGIVALGMTAVIILGGIDLSVGSMVALAGGCAIYAMNAAVEPWGTQAALAVAIATCLLVGPLLGLANGLVISLGRVAPFVATLGTLAIFRSLIVAPAQGAEIRSAVPDFSAIGGSSVFLGAVPLRVPSLVFLGLAILAHLALSMTTLGRRVYAIGDNATAARYAGVPIARVTTLVYTFAGACCGIAALLNASRLNSVSSTNLGLLYELDAIAAVVIGGTRLQGGSGRIFGTVVGVLILGVVGNMLNMLGVSNFYHGLVKGLIIIAAVLVQPKKA